MATPTGYLKALFLLLLLHADVLADDDDSRSGEDSDEDVCNDLLLECCQHRGTHGPTKVCVTTCQSQLSWRCWNSWVAVFQDACQFVDQICRFYNDIHFGVYYEDDNGNFGHQICNEDHVASKYRWRSFPIIMFSTNIINAFSQ